MDQNLLEVYKAKNSKYMLVNLAARRIKQLLSGERPMVQPRAEEDHTDITFREIEEGMLMAIHKKTNVKVVDIAKQ